MSPLEVCRCEVTLGSSMLKANALRRAVEAERRVYAKGGDAAGIIADLLGGASIETNPPRR
jgi:hypothetical protein